MSTKRLNLIGETFGRLTVVKEGSGYVYPNTKNRATTWICECSCGNTTEVRGQDLKSGSTQSCGCYAEEQNKIRSVTHGKTHTKEYKIWGGIKTRCNNPNAEGYKNYGGRGITICDRWNNSFEAFYADMGDCPEGATIDRIDSDGNYEASNCRWELSKTIQSIKRRKPSNNSSGYKGVYWHKRNLKWMASIAVNKKTIHLGCFDNKKEAIKARKAAEEQYHKPLLGTK